MYDVLCSYEDIQSSMKWRSSWILKLIKTATMQSHRSHRCHCITQYRSSWPSGPMAEFYSAQQKALGHVVEGMRLCFQLRGQIRCLVNVFEPWGREAVVLPPSLVDSSESISDIDTDIDTDTDCNRNSLFLTRFIKWARPAIVFPYTWD